MADTTEDQNLKVVPGADSAPLLPSEEKREDAPAPETSLKEPKSETFRLPDPVIHHKYVGEPQSGIYRWIILASLSLSIICVGAISSYYNFLEVLFVDMFEKPLSSINGIYMMYLVFYIPSTLFVHYPISQKFGTFGVLIAGTGLSIISVWLRLGITGSSPYGIIFLSNIFAAIGAPLYINEIPRVMPLWFLSKERPLMTTILILSVQVGTALGHFLPFSHMSYAHPFLDKVDISRRKDQLYSSSLLWAIMFTILMIGCVVPHWKKPSVEKE